MRSIVCDASVLFKLVVTEPDSDVAVRVVHAARVIVPEFSFLEVGNALWFRVGKGELHLDEAQSLLEYLEGLQFELRSGSIKRALAISVSINHAIYDCFYLALAEELDIPLVTADRRFLSAVRRAGLSSVEVKSLADFT